MMTQSDAPRPDSTHDEPPSDPASWASVLARSLPSDNVDPPMSTGYSELDRRIGGLGPGTLTLICGAPGVGTSTMLLDMVRHNVFRDGVPVSLYCGDRTERDIAVQVIAAQARVRRRTVSGGPRGLEEAVDWDAAMRWADQHADAPLRVVVSADHTIDAITDDLHRRSADGQTPHLVAIDPLPSATTADEAADDRDRVRTTRRLKSTAMSLGVPIIATAGCDIPNGVTDDATVFNAMARIADTVLGVYRDDLHCQYTPRSGEVDVTIRKSRSGATGEFVLASLLDWGRFAEMLPSWPE